MSRCEANHVMKHRCIRRAVRGSYLMAYPTKAGFSTQMQTNMSAREVKSNVHVQMSIRELNPIVQVHMSIRDVNRNTLMQIGRSHDAQRWGLSIRDGLVRCVTAQELLGKASER